MKTKKIHLRSSSRAVALEPRLLFDGAGAVAVADGMDAFDDVFTDTAPQETRADSEERSGELFRPGSDNGLLALVDGAAGYQPLLAEAEALAQQQLQTWVNSAEFLEQAAQIFSADAGSAEWQAQLDSLRSDILNGNYSIRTEVRSSEELNGTRAAYSAAGTTGQPTIYLSAQWLADASSADISAVLLQEIGHDIDNRLNNGADSQGDEGAAFASLLTTGSANLEVHRQSDDRTQITLDGEQVRVEHAGPYNIAQVHFVTMPEDQIWSGIQNVYSGGSDNKIESIIAITATSKDTHIVYDHWEDGYEADIKNPAGASTRIWWYNASGQWVDVKTGTTLTDGQTVGNVTAMGQTLILRNQVNKNSMATIDFDGGDKIGSTKAISVTRAGWDTKIGTIVGGAVNLIDVGNAGTSYVIPVGTNTTEAPKISGTSILQKDSLFIMAYENNTVVTVNLVKADGTPNGSITRTLQQGQSWYIGGLASGATVAGTGLADAKAVINEGTKVTADKKIGVNMLSGSSTSQNRWYGIAPTESWGNSYYAPVATVGSATSHIYLFNNNSSDIIVKYETLGAGGVVVENSVTVLAGKSKVVAMPASAGHFYTADDKAFYAVATVDPTTSRDWSYSLVAERTLTDRFVVAWGPGNGNTANASTGVISGKNGSPVWVTAVDDTYLYIDSTTTELKNAAGTTIAKDVDKSIGGVSAYKIDRLQSYRLRDTSDNNQTGLVVYTLDGTLITAAWGEDATVADTGSPYLDMGTTISPYPDYVLEKKAAEIVNHGRENGVIEAGDEVRYTITLTNRAVIELLNINIKDKIEPASSAEFIDNSLTLSSFDEQGKLVWKIEYDTGESKFIKTYYQADGSTVDTSKGTGGKEDASGFVESKLFDNSVSGGFTVENTLDRDAGKNGLQIGGFIQFTYKVTIKEDISKELADANFVVSNSVKLQADGVTKDKVNNVDLSGTITDGVVTFISGAGGSEVSSFEPGNDIWIRVTDMDQNKNATAAGTLTVILTNATTGEKETVTLTETGVNTGIFEGKVSTTRGTGSATDNPADGQFKLKRGDEIKVEYTDPNTGGTNPDGSDGVDNPTNWGINSPNYQAGENNNVRTALVDDSGISVNDILVNEASPFGVFTVQGAQGQKVELALGTTGTGAGHATSDVDYTNSLEYFDVTDNAWKTYNTGDKVEIKNTDGTLLVRNPIKNDPVFEGPETYELIVTPMKADGTTPGSATTGTATIFDDGTGTIWKDPVGPNPSDPTGEDPNAPKDHDRFPQVDNPVVNEASGHVVFTVTTQPNDTVTQLTFKNDTATGGTVDGSTPKDGTVDYENGSLEYSTDNGTTWTSLSLTSDSKGGMTTGVQTINTGSTGTLLVRTKIENDYPYEYSETFTLAVDTITAGHAVGTATIKDDGTGDVFDPTTGAKDPGADKNDDRAPITINNPTVNEASGYVVFDIQGKKDQVIDLALADGTATGADLTGADAGDNAKDYENRLDQLQYWDGDSWENYVQASGITITEADGSLKVRVKIHNDTPFEGAETFKLTASDKNVTTTTATGIATIFDDGTGDIYDNTTGDKDTTTPKNDDRIPVPSTVITIDNPVVNEGSGYVIFTITTQNTTDKITKLTLADGTATSTGSNEGDVDYVIGTFEYWDGSAWQTYTNDTDLSSGTPIAVQTNGSNGELKVRVKINQDSLYEQSETFTLKVEGKDVSNNDLTAATGTATIKDDGTGSIWEFTDPGNSPPVPNDPSNPGSTPFDDDRILVKVDNPVVNEASGYVVFTVNNTNTTNPMDVKLSLTDGTAKGSANVAPASGESDKDFRNNSFQYWNGSAWVEYTPGSSSDVTIAANGELKVRVQIYNDTVYEGAETFDLNVTPSSGTAVKGTATILDDGTGSIWEFTDPLSPNEPTPTPKDPSNPGTTPFNDDRKPYVSSPTVNEGSEYVVFEVTTVKNEVLSDLKFADNTAKVGTVNGSEPKDGSVDYGSTLEYSTDGGSNWQTYTSGNEVTVNTGTLLVRTKVANDDNYEVSENFNLTVTVKSDGKTATGVATILDDGTGSVWVDDPDDSNGKLIEKPYNPSSLDGIVRDDDRPVSVNSPTVNEGSGYIVFEVGGITGTKLQSLTLGDGTAKGGSATDGTPGNIDFDNSTPLQYYNGSAWVDFAPGTTAIPAGGTLLVRVAIFNDTAYEKAETFTLTAKTTGGKEATGTGTIKDDGTGDVWNPSDSGQPNGPVTKNPSGFVKDDDRTISITDGGKFEGGNFTAGSVREDVQYTYFEVSGVAEGVQVKLAVSAGDTNTATVAGFTTLQFSTDNGTTWQNYSDTNKPVAPSSGKILVRVDISSENDDPIEPDETFKLTASYANNVAKAATGVGTITDKLANAPKITPDDMNNGTDYPDAKEKVGEITVYEHGLKDSSGKQTATGTLKVEAEEGIKEIILGDDSFTLDQLRNGQGTITTPLGTLKVTEVTVTDGPDNAPKKVTLTYTYTLNKPDDHTVASGKDDIASTEEITIGVKDDKENTAENKITISIIDDKPLARNDEASLIQVTPSVGGSVMGNDYHGGDTSQVTGIQAGSGTADVSGNVDTRIKTEYGWITVKPDGSYVYELDRTDPRVATLTDGFKLQDHVTYTITDEDGDTSTAVLTITINPEKPGSAVMPPPNDPVPTSPLYDPTRGENGSPLTGSAVITDPSVYFATERWSEVHRLPVPLHPVVYVNNEVTRSQAQREFDDYRAASDMSLATPYEFGSVSLGSGLGQDPSLFVSHAVRQTQGYASTLEARVASRLGRTGLSGDDLLAAPELRQPDPEQMVVAELFEQQQPAWIGQPQVAEADAAATGPDMDAQLLAEAPLAGAAPSFSEQLRGGGKRLPMAARDKTFLTN